MSIAYIPSPSRGVWHLGPLPVRAYVLCIVLGVAVAVAVASRRYRAIGGRPGVILDVATWAIPFGLAGARLDSVITGYGLYFGPHGDWISVFELWDGGLGIPGAIIAGAAGAWIACRRAGVRLSPVAGATAPAIAFGQAIGRWGNWFNQELYGRPSSLPWALEISPSHRLTGYESFVTFQPAFLYESIWDLLVGLAVIWATRRLLLTGDRAFALYVALYSVGMFATQSLRIDVAGHLAGLRVNEWIAILAFAGAAAYLYRTRHVRGPDVLAGPAPAAAPAGRPPTAATLGAAPSDATAQEGTT
ncbi:MAG TPA: prolipoprotein diacylglyceryl transferase family protein [Streptosporangiaceae bacterium]|nr:prolipoprotein diacylglyceryl transferase family protein [Streptosporangiaceae bacterium]